MKLGETLKAIHCKRLRAESRLSFFSKIVNTRYQSLIQTNLIIPPPPKSSSNYSRYLTVIPLMVIIESPPKLWFNIKVGQLVPNEYMSCQNGVKTIKL